MSTPRTTCTECGGPLGPDAGYFMTCRRCCTKFVEEIEQRQRAEDEKSREWERLRTGATTRRATT